MIDDLLGCQGIGVPGSVAVLDKNDVETVIQRATTGRINALLGLNTADYEGGNAALEQALMHLTLAVDTRADGYPIDLMAIDVRTALRAIGDVTGENIDDAVLTEIFSRFCIGK